jgi:tRNA G18 (ribose-2'-O)-methylase SpoU
MNSVVLIVHNLRSSHNVGSLLRTAEGLGVDEVYLTGYTPFPLTENDSRLPHISQKLDKQIAKTALGAEKSLAWRHEDDIATVISDFCSKGYSIVALEQASGAIALPRYTAPDKLALIVGREVEGIEPGVLKMCDQIIEIPMRGSKESFNVVQAAAMALYHITIGR